MTVTTNAARSIVNWQSFSIGSGATVAIQQPGATSANLNRVVGSGGAIDPSLILGTLQSNGRVFLLNPSGIVFGAGAQVDVAGLVASTLRLSDADFLANRLRFTDGAGAGSVSVLSQASINAAGGGEVYLVGSSVTNSGVITSPKGEVILAAGNSVELVNPGTPNLRVEITAPDNEARNLGSIVAEAGRVGIYAGLIHQGSGATVRADSAVATEDGRIILKATKNTTIDAGSTISASGPSGGQVTIQSGDTTLVAGSVSATGSAGKGGTVQVLGNLVGLIDDASIDVSGETGGGTALVGGDFQGKNPGVQNAFRTYFGPNATIKADAIGNGDGGTVVVWSDDATRAYGTISARGGSQSGDGGFVEVSGKRWLDFQARVSTSAPNGRTGTLLLDPEDVCINSMTSCGGCGGSGSFTGGGLPACGGTPSIFRDGGGGESIINWATIQGRLGENHVVITTHGSGAPGTLGNIRVIDDSPNLLSSNNFLLVAHNDVNVGGRIWNTSTGELRIYAGWDEALTPVTSLAAASQVPFASAASAVRVVPGVGDINVMGMIDMQGNTLLRSGRDVNVNSQTVSVVSSVGSRFLTVQADRKVMLDHSLLRVDVSGGEGAAATIKILAGTGGVEVVSSDDGPSIFAQGAQAGSFPTGPASIFIGTQEEPVLGPVVLRDGAFVHARGGYGFNVNGGDARIDVVSNSGITVQNNSGLFAEAGFAGGGLGVGGSSVLQLITNGDINIVDSNSFGCFSCSFPSGVTAKAGGGDSGGGSAQAILSAGGNINAQSGFVGAEGRGSGFARVTAAANGAVSITNFSVFMATVDADNAANGGPAQTNVIGNSVTVSGFSDLSAVGGSGTMTGGASSVNVIAAAGQAGAAFIGEIDPLAFTPAGPITISGAEGITANGGHGATGVGDTAVTVLAGGPLSIIDTISEFGGRGVVATGGNASSGPGGNASTLISGSSVTSTRSHVGSIGGTGSTAGGSAVSAAFAFDGDLVIDGSGSTELTFFAQGGHATGLGGIGGTSEISTFSLGITKVIQDHVHSKSGGASQGISGDANIFSIALGGFESMDATIEASAEFGGQQGGNGLLFILAPSIRAESTVSSSESSDTLIARGGSTNPSGTPGSGTALFTLTGPTGSLDLVNERVEVTGGRLGSSSTDPIGGTGTIVLTFTERTSGGFSVNGVEGAITGSPVGFFVNDEPAIPGTNFLTVYLGVIPPDAPPAPPPTLEQLPPALDQVVTALNDVAKDLAETFTGDDSTSTKEEKDQKKKQTVCN
jgi:filamentous hemagglutinin family protein